MAIDFGVRKTSIAHPSTAAEMLEMAAKDPNRLNIGDIEVVRIPAGKFLMGSRVITSWRLRLKSTSTALK